MMMSQYLVSCLLLLPLLVPAQAFAQGAKVGPDAEPAWARAADRKPAMTAAEAKVFMKRLAQYVSDHHLKKDARSPQRGMIYEYYWVAQEGTQQQWIQGEAL